MLAAQAFEQLREHLASAIAAMDIVGGKFGCPEEVKRQSVAAEKLFQGYAQAKPGRADAYAAALAFLRGQPLDAWQRDLLAPAIAEPVRECSGTCVLAHPHFPKLLATYEDEARRGELWRLTWHGLLVSYFAFDPTAAKEARANEGWRELHRFLERTWPAINRQQAGSGSLPLWIDVLRHETAVLSERPVDKYAKAYLAGDTGPAECIAADLGIPSSSWFWHALVLSAVHCATAGSDAEFRPLIPRLIRLIQDKPAFRDEAIERILVRYHDCRNAPQDDQLRDFVVQSSVWKNPKLRAAGIATAWNRVPESVWMMVLGWVNERNLKDFFDILAARNKADEGRLAFWSQYLKQISWTRLVFGADTMALKNSNPEVRNLIAREEGAYAQLTANRDVDAFMMRIGRYIVVEFSKKPNAAYVYEAAGLRFDLYQKSFSGGTDDLKYGYYDGQALKIVHRDGWEYLATQELKRRGISPDREDMSREPTTSIPRPQGRSAKVDLAALQMLVSQYPEASIKDMRTSQGGRLCVRDSGQNRQLAAELEARGFKWANKLQVWYYPES